MHARDRYLEDQNHQGTHREHLSQVPAIRVPRLCVARPPDPCVYTVGDFLQCVCVCAFNNPYHRLCQKRRRSTTRLAQTSKPTVM